MARATRQGFRVRPPAYEHVTSAGGSDRPARVLVEHKTPEGDRLNLPLDAAGQVRVHERQTGGEKDLICPSQWSGRGRHWAACEGSLARRDSNPQPDPATAGGCQPQGGQPRCRCRRFRSGRAYPRGAQKAAGWPVGQPALNHLALHQRCCPGQRLRRRMTRAPRVIRASVAGSGTHSQQTSAQVSATSRLSTFCVQVTSDA
jgi:hypothetical protein